MNSRQLEIIQRFNNPFSIVALVLFLLSLVVQGILQSNIIEAIGGEAVAQLLNIISIGSLIVGGLALLMGIVTAIFRPKTEQVTLTGIVRYGDGNPVEGATVFVTGFNLNDTTNGEGYFELKVPKRNQWTIIARKDNYTVEDVIKKEQAADSLTLQFEKHLPRARLIIRGHVYSYIDGNQIAVRGASVHVVGVNRYANTNDQGYFELEVDQQSQWTVHVENNNRSTEETVMREEIDAPIAITFPAIEKVERRAEPRTPYFYQYISDAKVDMLIGGLNLNTVPEDRVQRVELVTEFLQNNDEIGTIEETNVAYGRDLTISKWFKGRLRMWWGPYWPGADPDQQYAVWFAGTIGTFAVFLGGSSRHLLGRGSESTIYASDLPGILGEFVKNANARLEEDDPGTESPLDSGQRGMNKAKICEIALSYALQGESQGQPYQSFEFVARRLLECEAVEYEGKTYSLILGSPLFIREPVNDPD